MFSIYSDFSPHISVIMPTYNRAAYLKRSIGSLLNQSEKSWELIIVDDGSTDHTFDVVDRLIQQDERVRYMKQKNRRPARAINAGFQAAVGTYVTILCSDDAYEEHHLALRVEFMKSNPQVDFLHGGVDVIGDPYVVDVENPNKKIHLSKCAVGGSFFAKRTVMQALGGFHPVGFGGDADLLRRAQKKFVVKKITDKTYQYYTETPNNLTGQKKSSLKPEATSL